MTVLLTIGEVESVLAPPPRMPAGCPFPAVLEWPEHPAGLVALLHAGRKGQSPRHVDELAAQLRASGLGTLRLDLAPGSHGEPIEPPPHVLLAERAQRVAAWLDGQPTLAHLPLGLMGMEGAAAAAMAAASTSRRAEAVVVLGGEPDRADDALAQVAAPVLLLVWGAETEALRHHQNAFMRIGAVKRLVAISHAGRPCSETEAAAEAARWSAIWFVHHLAMERTWRHGRSAGV